MVFADRVDAGIRLGRALEGHLDGDAVVLALPRGGIPVAVEVARVLGAPLDVVVVREVGLPARPEVAMSAVAEDGTAIALDGARRGAARGPAAEAERRERAEVRREVRRWRRGRPPVSVAGQTVVLVDDGSVTGTTAIAAVHVARSRGASRVVVGVPVAAPDAAQALRREADEVVVLETRAALRTVDEAYRDVDFTGDEEIADLLLRAARGDLPALRPGASRPSCDPEAEPDVVGTLVAVPAGDGTLVMPLVAPPGARALVVLVHGANSSRFSARHRTIAHALRGAGFATATVDLLTAPEELQREHVADVPMLAERLVRVTAALREQPAARGLPVAWCAAGTGAAAALWAAADGADVVAIVSQAGRPDLAASRLAEVRVPTLLVVGERDEVLLDLNRAAQRQLTCPTGLVVVPGLGHLVVRPGAAAEVAALCDRWLTTHLPAEAADV